MGNQQQKEVKNDIDNFKHHNALDQLATKYILTQNFQDMKRLSTKAYCDKLIILTTDVIKRFLNDKEITYLSHKITDGIPADKMEKQKVVYLDANDIKHNVNRKSSTESQKFIYDSKFKTYVPEVKNVNRKSLLQTLDVHDSTTKDRMCKGIAKFYIKIAHLYAAILKTINPLYIYKDKYGKEHHYSLLNKDKIPKNVDVKLSEINLCTRRINALQFTTEGDNLKVNISKACNLNRKDTKYTFGSNPDEPDLWGISKTGSLTLGEDVGIPELDKLYFDKYDYVHGKFMGMSLKSKKQYEKDLKVFYTHFTGKTDYNQWNITGKKRFSDIPLTDFHSSELCKKKDAEWKKTYVGKNEGLFKKYADNLKKMMRIAETNQKSVINVLDKVFEWVKKTDGTTVITLKQDLTEEKLDAIVSEVRNLILELYYTCEKDFKNGLQIFEAIVKERYLKTSIARSKDLEKKMDVLVANEMPNEIAHDIKQTFTELGTKAARIDQQN